ALAAPSIAECVSERVQHRLVGGPEQQLLGKPEALGALEDRLVAAVCGYASLDACHLPRPPEPDAPSCGPTSPQAAPCRPCASASSTFGAGGGWSTSCAAPACRCASRAPAWRAPSSSFS